MKEIIQACLCFKMTLGVDLCDLSMHFTSTIVLYKVVCSTIVSSVHQCSQIAIQKPKRQLFTFPYCPCILLCLSML